MFVTLVDCVLRLLAVGLWYGVCVLNIVFDLNFNVRLLLHACLYSSVVCCVLNCGLWLHCCWF